MKTVAAGVVLASLLAASAVQSDPRQLIAHLRLTPEEAATLTLSQIAALKFNRDSNADDQQSVGPAHPVGVPAFLPVERAGNDD